MEFISNVESETPCCRCEGVVYEFSVPNEMWNKVVRKDGKEHDKEYLCIWCYVDLLHKYILLEEFEKKMQAKIDRGEPIGP